MAKSFFIKDEIGGHFKLYSKYYFTTLGFVVFGVLFGIVLIFSDFNYMSLLKSSDNVLYDYITGVVDNNAIFYSKIKDLLVFALLIFLFCLTTYTSIISCLLISYQVSLIVLSIKAITSMFGFSGFVSSLLFILPINLLIIFVFVVYNSILLIRVFEAKKYKRNFIQSFVEESFYWRVITAIFVLIILAFIISFISPIFFKSIVVLVY